MPTVLTLMTRNSIRFSLLAAAGAIFLTCTAPPRGGTGTGGSTGAGGGGNYSSGTGNVAPPLAGTGNTAGALVGTGNVAGGLGGSGNEGGAGSGGGAGAGAEHGRERRRSRRRDGRRQRQRRCGRYHRAASHVSDASLPHEGELDRGDDDGGRKDRPASPGRARQRQRRRHHDLRRRLCLQPGQLGARAEHPDRMGGHDRRLPQGLICEPPQDPDHLRPRRRARRRTRLRRDGVPAQRRPRRHPQPGARRRGGARRRRGVGGRGRRLSFRAGRRGGARRAMGPHVRGVRRDGGARLVHGHRLHQWVPEAQRPLQHSRQRQALSRRRRYRERRQRRQHLG